MLFVLVFLLSDKWGSELYQWLEREHGQYVYQYATEGQFSENVYLSEETDRAFGVPGGLAGISAEESLSNLARDLMNQQWETAETLEKNEGYMAYLREQGTGLTGLYAFCERIAGLQDSMVYACRYLLFLLWVVVLYFLMRCRPALYFSMGLLCIFATCVKLSGKFIAVFFFGASTYTPILTDGLLAPLLEAMLTFLIFDITIASLEKVRLGHKVEALYQDLPALQWLTVRLAGETEHEGWYRQRHLPAAAPFQRLPVHRSTHPKKGRPADESHREPVRPPYQPHLSGSGGGGADPASRPVVQVTARALSDAETRLRRPLVLSGNSAGLKTTGTEAGKERKRLARRTR